MPKDGGKQVIDIKIFRMLFKIDTIKVVAMTIGLTFLWSCNPSTTTVSDKIKHVVVIGIDGLSPQGIQGANTPTIDSLIINGAYSYQMRAGLPTSSGPNWASMIMGADVEQHGITSNSWTQNNNELPAVVETSNNKFPSIFDVIKRQTPERKTAAIYDWGKFGRYLNEVAVDINIDGDHEDGTTASAIEVIQNDKPDFTFIHLDHVDHAGHAYSHTSDEYYQSVQKADRLINQIIAATKSAGIFENTLFIISADHGGRGYSHGGATLGEIEIPFIISGAGIKSNYLIEESIYQYDNASTVAFAFGLKQPQPWIGRPVKSAFLGQEKPVLNYHKAYIHAPVILPVNDSFTPSGGVYENEVLVELKNPNTFGTLYYTLDGSLPTAEKGIKYSEPFTLNKTTVLKVGLFKENSLLANVSNGFFRVFQSKDESKLGVNYKVYTSDRLVLPHNLGNLKTIKQGYIQEFNSTSVLNQVDKKEGVLINYKAEIVIDKSGEYTFYTASDDDSMLFINGDLIVSNNGKYNVGERGASLYLDSGKHAIEMVYYNRKGFSHLSTFYEGPKIPKQIIPINQLYRN
jgi:hypothetical protein